MSQDLIKRLRARPCENIGPPAIELEAADRIETLMAGQAQLAGYDLAKLKALAQAAETGGQHIFTNPRDSNAWQANDAWHQAATPELFLALFNAIGAR